ncbi:MAG TPA: hypothetical protein VFV93_09490 [Thermomicrobiales bacterium]|nr:hypothetical protein [Thermomicrobiales bacterium]
MALANTGCIQGKVVLRIPLGDASDPARHTTFPLPGVTVTLSSAGKGARSAGSRTVQTDAYGEFCIDNLPSGMYTVWYPDKVIRDGSAFPAYNASLSEDVDAPLGSSCAAGDCGLATTFAYVVAVSPQAAAVTASAQGIDAAMQTTAASTYGIGQILSDASQAVADHHGIIDATMTSVLGIDATLSGTATDINAIAQTLSDATQGINNHQQLIKDTANAVQDISTALQAMSVFPYAGPTESNGYHPQPPAGEKRTPVAATAGIRGGVQAALADIGLTGDITDAGLASLFPSETDGAGDVTYKWAGPAVATPTTVRSNGARQPGEVKVSGGLALFQQQAQAALREVRNAFSSIKPINSNVATPAAIEAQKAIVLDTIQSIVDEPDRPEGLRALAVDAHFDTLLTDTIVVSGNSFGGKVTRTGNLSALEYMLGFSTVVITDQDAEAHATEWQRAEDAVLSLKDSWDAFRKKKDLKLGERLQDLDGYFEALSEAADSARSMLKTVRFSAQEQGATQFPATPGGPDEVTTDDVLSMVDELAERIGPKYITDWKGRGIGTIEGRARKLKVTVTAVNASNKFPFDNARVKSAFNDIVRLLASIEALCKQINAAI